MLKSIPSLIVVAVAVGASSTFPQAAIAEETICQSTLGAITVDNVKVPQGQTCTLRGTTVKGSVVVNTGASLTAIGAKVNGNIQAEGAISVNVNSNAVVGGSIQIVQGRSVQIANTRISGDLQAFQNTGGVTIRQNRINGNLQCKENIPAPTGGGNAVNGNKEDQCARL